MSSSPVESRRRLACDRCHAQKLRCLRTNNCSEARADCDRCLRASVPCVYSPPNRIGRPAVSRTTSSTAQGQRSSPSKSSSNNSNNSNPPSHAIPAETTMNDVSAEVGPPGDFPLDAATADIDLMAFINDSPMSWGDESAAGHGTSLGCTLPDEGLAALDDAEFASFGSNNPGGPEQVTTSDPMDRDHVRELMSLVLSQHKQFHLFERSRSESMRTSTPYNQTLLTRLHNYPVGDMMENARKLTELVDELGKAASRTRAETATASAEASGSGNNAMGDSPDLTGGLEYFLSSDPTIRPLDEASLLGLNFSNASSLPPAELSTILTPRTASSTSIGGNWHASTMSAAGPNGGSSSRAAAPARMDMSTTLLVVSCHLRLARIFVLFFTDLHSFLLCGASDTSPTTETGHVPRLFPGLKLGSFQSFAGIGLEISIVVEVSEHMLTRLHNAMGWSRYHNGSGATTVKSSSGLHFNGGGMWNKNVMEMITPTLMRAVQAQERLDVQDERGDSITQLSLVIDDVKKLLRARPFL